MAAYVRAGWYAIETRPRGSDFALLDTTAAHLPVALAMSMPIDVEAAQRHRQHGAMLDSPALEDLLI